MFGGTSSLIKLLGPDASWTVVCDPKWLAYSNMIEAIPLNHQVLADNPGDNHDNIDGDDDDDHGMDLDEHRSAVSIAPVQRPLAPPLTVMINVDPNETFEASEEDENETIAAAIVAISDYEHALDPTNNAVNNHDCPGEEKPSVWHVSNGSGGWVDTRKVVALLNQNTGAYKLSKDRATKIIQSFSVNGRKYGTAAYGEVVELDDVVQSVGLNSIASFCFEDASVEGGLRFWLGKVMSMVHRPKTGRKKLLTSRIALRDIPADLYLSCVWYTPVLQNDETVLTAQHYDLLPQQLSDLTTQVDAKYIVSVVELQQEGRHFCLSKDDLTAITTYIKETAAAFAPVEVVPVSQSVSEKVTEKKRKSSGSASSSTSASHCTKGYDKRPYSTTSSTRAAKKNKTE
jgi:hypothetical protein